MLAPHVNPFLPQPWRFILLVMEVIAAGTCSDWILDQVAKARPNKQHP